jgi:flagellar motor switch protein FliG
MEELGARVPEIARLVDHCEFIFADFRRLDDASLFDVFNRFGDREWAVAWKLADDALKAQVLRLLRDERRKEFLDFAAAQPKMPRIQVLAVQLNMARKARDLLRIGKLRMLNRQTVVRADARARRQSPKTRRPG